MILRVRFPTNTVAYEGSEQALLDKFDGLPCERASLHEGGSDTPHVWAVDQAKNVGRCLAILKGDHPA